jgi:hypothetical protein
MYEPTVELLEAFTEQEFICSLCHSGVKNCPKYRITTPIYLGDAYIWEHIDIICSVDVHAEEIQVKQIEPKDFGYFQGVPSLREKFDWIWSFYNHPTYPRDTTRSGKWMLYIPNEEIDNAWSQVKTALSQGKLGRLAKVISISGAKPDRFTGKMRQVLIIFTYDWQDATDTLRILEVVRNIGLTQQAYWKANEDTDTGRYSTNTDQPVSKYWAREGKVELLSSTQGRRQKQSQYAKNLTLWNRE